MGVTLSSNQDSENPMILNLMDKSTLFTLANSFESSRGEQRLPLSSGMYLSVLFRPSNGSNVNKSAIAIPKSGPLWREERSKATEGFGSFSMFVVVVVVFPLCWAGI